MFKRIGVVVLSAAALMVFGCGPKAPTPTVHESMTEVMAPQAQTIWDVTSRAFNTKGDGLEPSKISPADWAQLEDAGRQLKDRALVLAKARRVSAAAPGDTIMGGNAAPPGATKQTWDAASARQVQTLIAADPALFAEHARDLAKAGDTLVKASRTKDVKTLYEVSSGLDEVCDGCHQRFWGTDEPPPFPR